MSIRRSWVGAAAVASAIFAGDTATASSLSESLDQHLSSLRPAWMKERAYAVAPMGFIRFCLQYQAECPGTGEATHVQLTAERWRELAAVNSSINRKIRPVNDVPGQDIWSLDVTAGDCDDYAVQKRHELIARGWPAETLSLAVAMIGGGVPHLVLTVRTDYGDLVLDNLQSKIVLFDRTGYVWLKRQSAHAPRFWVQIDNRAIASPAEGKLVRNYASVARPRM